MIPTGKTSTILTSPYPLDGFRCIGFTSSWKVWDTEKSKQEIRLRSLSDPLYNETNSLNKVLEILPGHKEVRHRTDLLCDFRRRL